jgi:hypothetical protein
MKKTFIAALICSASVVGVSAGSAFAGEVTGSGKGGPENNGVTGAVGNGRSACLYSGLEDHPVEPGTVQNWGHVKKAFGLTGGANWVPAVEEGCNPNEPRD